MLGDYRGGLWSLVLVLGESRMMGGGFRGFGWACCWGGLGDVG